MDHCIARKVWDTGKIGALRVYAPRNLPETSGAGVSCHMVDVKHGSTSSIVVLKNNFSVGLQQVR
jgi:hypothetical protein